MSNFSGSCDSPDSCPILFVPTWKKDLWFPEHSQFSFISKNLPILELVPGINHYTSYHWLPEVGNLSSRPCPRLRTMTWGISRVPRPKGWENSRWQDTTSPDTMSGIRTKERLVHPPPPCVDSISASSTVRTCGKRQVTRASFRGSGLSYTLSSPGARGPQVYRLISVLYSSVLPLTSLMIPPSRNQLPWASMSPCPHCSLFYRWAAVEKLLKP